MAYPLTKDASGKNHLPYKGPCQDSIFLSAAGEGQIIFPRFSEAVIDPRIPEPYATEYKEAYATLQTSELLSVVGSRRILQRLLRDFGGVNKADLFPMIIEFINQGKHPVNITDPLHTIREFGNIGAHPDDIQVSPEEAQWTLDVVRDLFDYFIIKPSENQKRIEELKQKKNQSKNNNP